MSETFDVSPVNPNDESFSGGCLCHPAQSGAGTQGPFVNFYAASSDEGSSPFAVACAPCIQAAARRIDLLGKPVAPRKPRS